VYNLWLNDDGLLELDFEDDDEVSVHIIFIASIQWLCILFWLCAFTAATTATHVIVFFLGCILFAHRRPVTEISQIRHVKYNSKICYGGSYLVSFDLYCPSDKSSENYLTDLFYVNFLEEKSKYNCPRVNIFT
jgi:hypothetical protein